MNFLNNLLNYIIAFGLVVVGLVFFKLRENESSLPPKISNQNMQDPQDLANHYLQEANKKVKQQTIQAQIAIRNVDKTENEFKSSPKKTETNPARVTPEQQIWKDAAVEAEKAKSAEEKFREELSQIQFRKKQSELEKKEYIRQYKENARKNGYEITINDNLEVTNVVPIRKPTNNDSDGEAFNQNEF